MNLPIILGSQSSDRRLILNNMGYEFAYIAPNIDEKSIRHPDPKKLVIKIAKAKAAKLISFIKSKPIPTSLLITADQVAVCNGIILEKPVDKEEAKTFLRMYKNHPVETVASVVVTNTTTREQMSGVDCALISIFPLSEENIDKVVSNPKTLHCCGGFTIDDEVISLYLEKVEGTKESIMGLPVDLTRQLINEMQAKS